MGSKPGIGRKQGNKSVIALELFQSRTTFDALFRYYCGVWLHDARQYAD